ncbi:T-cell differentiation antigen CD6 isoform X3 [Nycticebus coucang]|uniref:T-cell differentiation antigen CD6 isoform X3 n=1 Tax=Nycticebus coucang TaxID=9470 RepID=UPI00234CE6BA|nr:T-cell differentiation antigen CD6 isoform X3 [Nycticebus coucang]
MTPGMWLFLVTAGSLMAALTGHPSAAPSGQVNTSITESEPLEPGEQFGVRLANGSSRCSGTVEVRIGASWEPVCGALWSGRAAEAVCQALGCGGAEAAAQLTPPTPESGPDAGNASGVPNVTLAGVPAVLCRGVEWRLCDVVEHACSGDEKPARVTCAENRALRLMDGGGPCAGRVEMLERGQWGSVCDDTWDLEDAHVVCRQLGCGWAVQALPGLHFTPGRGPIHRDQVNCSGAEAYLWDCPGLPGDHYCGHKEDAGVVCSEHQSWRLTGGADPCEGQVEVYFRGFWNTVCDSEWYTQEAKVLCQTLGCGNVVEQPKGLPHSLSGKMFYSCKGEEPTLSDCFWRFNNSNLCRESHAARVLCSGSRSLHNLSTPEVPASVQPATVEPSVTVKTEAMGSPELMLLIPCIVLGILLLGSLISIAFILLKIKGKYVLNLPIQVRAPAPEDSDSSSDTDYEHYDFSTQPPVALTTFYNSQRHRVTDEEAQQNRFHMPPLEEGLEELHVSHNPATNPGYCAVDPPSLDPQGHTRSNSGSSTSSGENYCNNTGNQQPPWNPQVFSSQRSSFLEQPPNLELAGSRTTFSAENLALLNCAGLPVLAAAEVAVSWQKVTGSGGFQQGHRLMTALALHPDPGSGTRTSSRGLLNPLQRSNLGVQGPPVPSLTPLILMTTMTLEQPRLDPAEARGVASPVPISCWTYWPSPLPQRCPHGAESPPREMEETPHLCPSVFLHQAEPAGTALPGPDEHPRVEGAPPIRVSPPSLQWTRRVCWEQENWTRLLRPQGSGGLMPQVSDSSGPEVLGGTKTGPHHGVAVGGPLCLGLWSCCHSDRGRGSTLLAQGFAQHGNYPWAGHTAFLGAAS